jgi:hypothetical protein
MAGAVPTAMPSAQVGPRFARERAEKGGWKFSREKFN